MKKLIPVAAALLLFSACNNNNETTSEEACRTSARQEIMDSINNAQAVIQEQQHITDSLSAAANQETADESKGGMKVEYRNIKSKTSALTASSASRSDNKPQPSQRAYYNGQGSGPYNTGSPKTSPDTNEH